jgi:hypothetical protein
LDFCLKHYESKYFLVHGTRQIIVLFDNMQKTVTPTNVFDIRNLHLLKSIIFSIPTWRSWQSYSERRQSCSGWRQSCSKNVHQTVGKQALFEKVRGARDLSRFLLAKPGKFRHFWLRQTKGWPSYSIIHGKWTCSVACDHVPKWWKCGFVEKRTFRILLSDAIAFPELCLWPLLTNPICVHFRVDSFQWM